MQPPDIFLLGLQLDIFLRRAPAYRWNEVF
jgi:hypothetical protein